ncbi:MAG: FAD-dependent oxidoreductase [Oscillospiraceae bacterium]|nr:FAD-dependent oxidoreductase [Oscillospiraceae bacterium]
MAKETLSRREFLKSAAAAAAGLAFVGIGTPIKASAEGGSVFTPGTYTGKATGLNSDVTVTITVDETSILSCVVDASGETAEIGAAAADTLAEQILAAQSQNIDGVTGASVTSGAVKRAAEEALAQAKGIDVALLRAGDEPIAAEDWLGEEPEIAESEIVEEIDTEVLVIGAGHAGTFAACSAVENGAKTLLIEKMTHDLASGMRDTLAAVNSKQQIENDDNPDRDEVIRYICDWSQGYAKRSLVSVWADRSGETMDWLTERFANAELLRGFRHEVDEHNPEDNYPTYDVGHSIQYGEAYYEQLTMDVLLDYAIGLGLEVLYETPMVKLLKTGERVTGVIAKNAAGDYIRINASKGVILCAGGYSGNETMMRALQPWSLEQCCINYSKPGDKGDGIKACLWAGASMDSTHSAMIFERGGIKPNETGVVEDGQLFWMGSQPFLKVNLKGERFMNEYMPYDYALHAASQQPDHTYCMIWDSTYASDVERFATHGCSRLYPHVNGADPVFPLEYIDYMNYDLMERGYIVSADTLEELAEKLGLPAEAFLATVKRYNDLAAKGVDEDFGKESYRLSTLDTAPYYGIRQAGGYLICTMDGIRINETMHAIREDGTQIEGLYVCGDNSGSYFHGSYPNLLAGCAAGRSATFGRYAGLLAAQE